MGETVGDAGEEGGVAEDLWGGGDESGDSIVTV